MYEVDAVGDSLHVLHHCQRVPTRVGADAAKRIYTVTEIDWRNLAEAQMVNSMPEQYAVVLCLRASADVGGA